MVIFCGCRACEWYDRGKCSKVIGDTPACGSYRIVEEECLGADCPMCELVGHDEYIKLMDEVI